MNRMFPALLILGVLLLAAGAIAVGRVIRRVPSAPPQSTRRLPASPSVVPLDRFQAGVTIDWTHYEKNSAATRRLMDRLREEEQRQKPQEGRN